MKSLGRYVLVILACVKCVASQCIRSETCDCHCNCCYVCFGKYCDSCAKGWSGTTRNGCQRQNVAYNATTTSSSTSQNFYAGNAVDEDSGTYASTNREQNPQLTIIMSKSYNIKNIFFDVYAYRTSTFTVFVTNSTSNVLPYDNTCIRISVNAGENYKRSESCYRILTGDTIVIQKTLTDDTLVVTEVKVYQCSLGTYGEQCDSECRNCVDNICDGNTGVCEHGCNIGWQGKKCDISCDINCRDKKCQQYTGVCTIGCNANWYGETCNRQCPSQCESFCDRYLGCTTCQIGYNGSNCDPCYGNKYGKNCSLTCQNCNDCNNTDGCRECSKSFYGDLCELSCPNQCKNDECHRQSGVCIEGCKDGRAGDNCETPCKVNCATCNANDLCISCLNGMFGTNCEYRCPETCGGSKTCDKNNGVCSDCNTGSFGPNCTCLLGCEDAFAGKCFTKSHSLPRANPGSTITVCRRL